MVGLPVAVFLHNRFSGSSLSFLFFFPLRPSSSSLRRRSLLTAAGPSRFSPQEAPRLLRHCLYLPTSERTRPRARVQLAGGCILITFMSSDIPARFIAPAPADSAKTCEPTPPLPPLTYLLSYVPWSSHFASFVFLVFEIILRLLIRNFALLLDKNNLIATETVN